MRRSRQSGAALLIALVVVTLASFLGLRLVERAQSTVARSQALIDRAQVNQLAHGMSILAEQVLAEALKAQRQHNRSLDLSQWTPPYAIPGGVVRGRLIDLGGRFNLNALFHPEPQERAHARLVFQNLLVQLNLNSRLSSVWLAWLDGQGPNRPNQDSVPRAPMMHVSEMLEWPSMDWSTYQTLSSWVSVLPTPVLSINVNETTPNVLAAAIFLMDESQAERFLSARPFQRREEIWSHPIMQGIDLSARERVSLVVESSWYLAEARVSLDRSEGRVDYKAFRLISASGSGYDFRYVSQGTP